VQQRDRDARHTGGVQHRHEILYGLTIECEAHVAFGVDALGHAEAQSPRHQRRGLVEKHVVLREAMLLADLDYVAKALGGDQGRHRALALDQRIGRERGAEDHQLQLLGPRLRLAENLFDAAQHRIFRSARRGEDLRGPEPGTCLQDQIGEGAAHVHREAQSL
jgi:hypothetical protein